MFDDIIQPKEEFYGGDDNPIEFEAEFEVDEDANVSYSFSDLEKVLNIEDSELEKAIDEAMKELFGDDIEDDCVFDKDCCDPGDGCDGCKPVPEPDYGQNDTTPETHTCDDNCSCEDDDMEKMEDLSLRR